MAWGRPEARRGAMIRGYATTARINGLWRVDVFDLADNLIFYAGPYTRVQRDACLRLFNQWPLRTNAGWIRQ